MSAALEEGDEDAARAAAEELVSAVDAAIAAGDVPDALRPELVAGVARLLTALPEALPTKPGKGKGRDKNDHGKDNDER